MTYPAYPTDDSSALAYAASLTEHHQKKFIAVRRPPRPHGKTHAAVQPHELPEFLDAGWTPVPVPALVNLTPHPVTIGNATLPPSGQVAQVISTDSKHPLSDCLPLPVTCRTFGAVTGLPPQSDHYFLIVSQEVADCVQRPDCLTVSPKALIQRFP